MKADAYLAAERGHKDSLELLLLSRIQRFGVMEVLGRPTLYFGEMERMLTAENIFLAYFDLESSTNYAEWANKNPSSARLLDEARKLAEEG